MQSNYRVYDYVKSMNQVEAILNSTIQYEERSEIPDRDELKYNNGYYVNCNALFVDIRGSSELPSKYQRRTLAKIYRSYISEVVAIMNGSAICKEINIVGDCVSGIFEASKKSYSKVMIDIAAAIHSLVNIINNKLKNRGYDPINIGIGISKGRALMIQAGNKGSGIKDVVWMGDVVNHASNLCGIANKEVGTVAVSATIYNDLENVRSERGELYQGWFYAHHRNQCYSCNVINLNMEELIS